MEQLWAEILTAIVSVSISYGVIKATIAEIARKVEPHEKAHDLLVELNTKVDMLLKEQRGKK